VYEDTKNTQEKRKREREKHNTFHDLETMVKRHCLNIEHVLHPRIYKTYERVI
jgi:hypothetical protein